MLIAESKEMDWLLDLDNCLYPYDNGLYHFINERMNRYIAKHLQVNHSKVDRLRTHFIQQYGNTLLGLMIHHQVDAEDFLQDIHDFPLDSFIKKDPLLIDFLDTHIQGKCYIFTNSPSFYAYRVLELLEINYKVRDVFDIHFVSYKGKPHKSAFQKVIESSGIRPSSTYFIDDMKENIATAQELGFHTTHIDTSIPYKNNYYSDLCIPRVLACKKKREEA